MSTYIKLAAPPTLTINMPTCNACCVEVEADAEGLLCPCCGTMWSHRDGEGDPGQLYEEYSGDDLPGDALTEDEAWRAGSAHEEAEREAAKARFEACEAKRAAKAAQAKFQAEAIADPEGQRLADAAVAIALPRWGS